MIQVGDTRRVAQADGRGFSTLGMEESGSESRPPVASTRMENVGPRTDLDIGVGVLLSRAAIGQSVVFTEKESINISCVSNAHSVDVVVLLLSERESDVPRGVDVEHVGGLVPGVHVLVDGAAVGIRSGRSERCGGLRTCRAGPGRSIGTRWPAPLMLLVLPVGERFVDLHVVVLGKLLREPERTTTKPEADILCVN
ncbi:hypothetical protein PRIPAC_71540 [Pristionchus pacificus]|uniref:Uncharacterized protein n=1 Tax=Pristionchus pacificus TaxID=54126 RepID=A0A2A6BG19_PRIPA|nr:hypothetical protein PRIPAC_71540 [Pristionchus pacificus]|eukprot:PDM64834.1 hypothetical protein PRIPAC_53090 [Pristionchus pacificus]